MRLTEKIAKAWFVNHCLEKGAEVEYWDLSDYAQKCINRTILTRGNRRSECIGYCDLTGLISSLRAENPIFVMLLTYSWLNLKPFLLLTKYRLPMIFIDMGHRPSQSAGLRLRIQQLARLTSSPSKYLLTVVTTLLSSLIRRLSLVSKYEIMFTTDSNKDNLKKIAKRIISINLSDFEEYKRLKKTTSLISGKYAVYLDQNFPDHPDNINLGTKLNRITFYASLNKFFHHLEKKYKLKLIIARHPTVQDGAERFDNREEYSESTANLVKDAEFVIAHTSTAVSYAILNRKAIIFIATAEIEDKYSTTIASEITNIARYLGQTRLNIDEPEQVKELVLKMPQKNLYDNYIYSYLTTPESENRDSQDIFWERVSSDIYVS